MHFKLSNDMQINTFRGKRLNNWPFLLFILSLGRTGEDFALKKKNKQNNPPLQFLVSKQERVNNLPKMKKECLLTVSTLPPNNFILKPLHPTFKGLALKVYL